MSRIHRIALAAVVSAELAAPAVAPQQNYSQVTQADIQRLQDSVTQATTEVQQMRSRDASRASQLQTQLDDVRDEVTYLKVKLRKEGSLQRREYASVRDRLDDLRSQATNYAANNAPSSSPTTTAASGNRAASGSAAAPQTSTAAGRGTPQSTAGSVEVPSGTELDVRLTNALNSGTAQVEDRFEGTTVVDLTINGRTVIPAGAVMRGVVTAVEPATRT